MDRKVKIPSVFLDYTTRRIITTEWIDGVPLANTSTCTIQKLIPVGVELFLTQLLDIGCFHADPHPGYVLMFIFSEPNIDPNDNKISLLKRNLLVTSDEGILCLLDFGLCAKVSAKERAAMTKALVNLLYRDFDKLVTQNTKELGFLPNDFDTEPLKPVIIKILSGGILEAGSNMHTRKRKLMEISSELNEIFFQYPFSVPPFFALVTRGLGLLEGIALSGDPEFDIFKASLPFVTSKRALSLLLSSSAGGQEKGMEKNETRVGFRKRSKKLFAWFLSK
jgi:aarF domain-containing kinase